MEDLRNQLSQLLQKNDWTDEERLWLQQYLDSTESNELFELMRHEFDRNLNSQQTLEFKTSRKVLENIHDTIKVRNYRTRVFYLVTTVAASLAGLFVLVSYLFSEKDMVTKPQVVKTKAEKKVNTNDASPASQQAVLTLGNGSQISLSNNENKVIARQGNTDILNIDGRLTYNASVNDNKEIYFNSISTPRGGQYAVVLPDKSIVWLNAASSIYFPTVFRGNERKVEVSGEAYFEVEHNASLPFIVKVKGGPEVHVLGTHFNIMSYKDESHIKTTLLEGSIKLIAGANSRKLKPGQESKSKNNEIKITQVDVSHSVAWKNGVFHFEKADIYAVMRQISRWYNVDVIFKDNKMGDFFYADIPRTTKLSDVLKALQLTSKVKFEFEGKTILVI